MQRPLLITPQALWSCAAFSLSTLQAIGTTIIYWNLISDVTIQALGKCYKNPTGLMFMSQMAALKSMDLLSDANDFVEQNTEGPINKLQYREKKAHHPKKTLKSPLAKSNSKFSYG